MNNVLGFEQQFLRITSAMAAGVTPSLWTFNDLMNA
jgi:hypothetical protein